MCWAWNFSLQCGLGLLSFGKRAIPNHTARRSSMPDTFISEPDAVFIGAGIMSATLGVFLKELEPSLNIEMFETLEGAGLESSDSWNNAGTGHAANCEMNYTTERADGSIDISKALQIN